MTKIYGVFINRALSFIFGGFSSVMAIARSCFGCLDQQYYEIYSKLVMGFLYDEAWNL